MSFSVWMSLVVICILGAMSPGPSLVVVAKNCLGGNWKNGVVTAWAHALGVGMYALASVLGLAIVLQHNPFIFKIIAYLGAGYLFWIGFNAVQSKGGVVAKLSAGKQSTLFESARDGAMISMLNPKLALFFLALFSQFVVASNASESRAVVVATPVLIDGLWYTAVSFMLTRPAVLDAIKDRAVLVDRLTGIVLMALAVRVIYTM
ncbi:LysE family translocator [Halodesulfovibrio spirochaetisodalis]|uniref:Lysine transporter LysE n=1 Tax=Halodesulfovibrio spirochaetisodalis TaxID=1560234 RepID=A0A1B7XB75_9BACT|nr:LysE family translocator [Halodesulfovibrio spirochaetisodalis]OBQ46633.1 lysine transporter LysE [Halodesulfovibrio spirochaetisodalis]